MTKRKKPKIIAVHPADENNQVLSLESKGNSHLPRVHRKTPCGGCPWKKENDGTFPAEAFRVSAGTAYDMSTRTFACHESGSKRPADCAGFLLHGAEHNLAIRLARSRGTIDLACVNDGGHDMHESYREMAIANGVDPDDHVLKACR